MPLSVRGEVPDRRLRACVGRSGRLVGLEVFGGVLLADPTTPVIADEKVPAVMLGVPERVFDGASAGGAVVFVEYNSDGLAGTEDRFGALGLGLRRWPRRCRRL